MRHELKKNVHLSIIALETRRLLESRRLLEHISFDPAFIETRRLLVPGVYWNIYGIRCLCSSLMSQ